MNWSAHMRVVKSISGQPIALNKLKQFKVGHHSSPLALLVRIHISSLNYFAITNYCLSRPWYLPLAEAPASSRAVRPLLTRYQNERNLSGRNDFSQYSSTSPMGLRHEKGEQGETGCGNSNPPGAVAYDGSVPVSDVSAKLLIYQAFVEGELEVPRHLARPVHDLYFNPTVEEFQPRTMWSLSNAFTSAFKKLDPVPQFKATAKLGSFLAQLPA